MNSACEEVAQVKKIKGHNANKRFMAHHLLLKNG